MHSINFGECVGFSLDSRLFHLCFKTRRISISSFDNKELEENLAVSFAITSGDSIELLSDNFRWVLKLTFDKGIINPEITESSVSDNEILEIKLQF